jgi:hypothetical protein
MPRLASCLVALAVASCSAPPPAPDDSTIVEFDLTADLSQPERFYDLPYPSDLRLSSTGTPDLAGFPNPRPLALIDALRTVAEQHPGFPVVPVAWFHFSAPVAPRDAEQVIPAAADSPILLVDIDPQSPELGRLFPTVATTPMADDYVPDNLLAVAPRPGFVLTGGRRYAFVVRRALADAAGKPLGVPPSFAALAQGAAPDGIPADRATAAKALHAPLWSALSMLGIAPTDVASAAVFTTGDVVADLATLSTALRDKYPIQIANLALAPGGDQSRFCELKGQVTFPQFQTGTPPFNNTGGLFEFTDGNLPKKQRDEVAPISITIPKSPMPDAGYPLAVYFHGSGGLSDDEVNDGPTLVMGGDPQPGTGPAYVLAPFGIAMAGSALPVNPERLPGATETAYLNLSNLPAFRDTFRQGVIEQRLYLEALRTLTIDPSLLTACSGPSLPKGALAYRFDPDHLVAQGQSMGGMYTNLISAVEPRIKASVPTGAGGYWSLFILKTSLIANAAKLVGILLQTDAPLTFLHPAMHLLETAWETSDPFVFMPRVARRPLPKHPVRPIYEPVGKDDRYFPTVLYDAIALSYGHQEAGDIVWPTMQQALALDHLDGILGYPITDNRPSAGGGKYTGVVVQYMGDGIADPHSIYRQLDAVKFQYGCFLSTFLARGTPTVPAPAPLGSACP